METVSIVFNSCIPVYQLLVYLMIGEKIHNDPNIGVNTLYQSPTITYERKETTVYESGVCYATNSSGPNKFSGIIKKLREGDWIFTKDV